MIGKGLVKQSATIDSVLQYLNETSLRITLSQAVMQHIYVL